MKVPVTLAQRFRAIQMNNDCIEKWCFELLPHTPTPPTKKRNAIAHRIDESYDTCHVLPYCFDHDVEYQRLW